jgi:toxin-antitoxin system PIN domain toxin
MLSIDTNILLAAVEEKNTDHAEAFAFLDSLQERDDVVISELVLLELYNLLRNAAVVGKPRTASQAADLCEAFRAHPYWHLVGFPPGSREFHDLLWLRLRDPQFARRRAYDLRTGLALRRSGVTEFATVNIKDFQDVGFKRVWNPLAGHRG